MSASRRPGTMIAAGVGAGLVFSCLLSGIVGVPFAQRLAAKKRAGWDLVPVVVAAVDIPAGSVVTMEMISQRSIPEQFVTPSMVRPDAASYVVDRPTRLSMHAGDVLTWTMVESATGGPACAALVKSLARQKAEVPAAVQRVVDEVERRASAPPRGHGD